MAIFAYHDERRLFWQQLDTSANICYCYKTAGRSSATSTPDKNASSSTWKAKEHMAIYGEAR